MKRIDGLRPYPDRRPPRFRGQGLDPKLLLKPAIDAWPTYNGDYSGKRFSPLTQINSANVGSLTLAWFYRITSVGAQRGVGNPEIKSTPLMVNGILYFTIPDHVWALDARTGEELWHYDWQDKGGHLVGNRGLGMYGDWLYFMTPDCWFLSLNAKDGKERWRKKVADEKMQYFCTMSPLVVKNHVLVGVGGDAMDVPGFLESRDPETGDVQWRWNTTPRKGEPGAETWPNPQAMEHGGGMTWMPGTYDPELNLIYWGTGNPNPVFAGQGRPGANLWTASIVALNADTGKLVWYHQPSPHDTHDWDNVETPVLFDGPFNGTAAQDAGAGRAQRHLHSARPHQRREPGDQGLRRRQLDERHRRQGPAHSRSRQGTEGRRLAGQYSRRRRNQLAASQLRSARPASSMSMPSRVTASLTSPMTIPSRKVTAAAAAAESPSRFSRPSIIKTGNIAWKHKYPSGGFGNAFPGILTTAGKLLFTGDPSGNLIAFDPAAGRILWHFRTGTMVSNGPSTYMLNGSQYLLVGAGDTLFAFKLAGDRK